MGIVKGIITAIVAALLLAFLFANREIVTIYFDPMGGDRLKPIPAPQYLVILCTLALGVIAGSITTWFNQSRHRRRAREAVREIERLRNDLEAAHASAAAAPLALARRA